LALRFIGHLFVLAVVRYRTPVRMAIRHAEMANYRYFGCKSRV